MGEVVKRRWNGRSAMAQAGGCATFEDEDSLPDIAFGAHRLAALAVSEVGTTKDEDDSALRR
jgi:hypothetical protein